MSTLINQIQLHYPSLSKLEKKVADYVMKHHQQLLNIHIKDLASQVDVSIATISRFCHKIGTKNFMEFKVLLRDTIKQQDQPSHPIELVNSMYTSVINTSRTLVSEKELITVANTIDQAKRVYLFGLGSSALTAEEFKLRLNRMGYHVIVEKEAHNMLFTASHLNEQDLIIVFSASGETKEVIDAIAIAAKNDVQIIALTNHRNTSISNVANQVIYTYSMQNFQEDRLLNSQLAFLYIIDILTLLLMEVDENFNTYTHTLEVLKQQQNKKQPYSNHLEDYL